MRPKNKKEQFIENSNLIQDALTQEYIKDAKPWEYLDPLELEHLLKIKKKEKNVRSDNEKAFEWLQKNIASRKTCLRIYESNLQKGVRIAESKKAIKTLNNDLRFLEDALRQIM